MAGSQPWTTGEHASCLFRHLLRTPQNMVLEKRSWFFFQELASPDSRTVHTYVEKSKQGWQEACVDKQEAPEKHIKEEHKKWKQSQVTQKGCRDIVQACQDRVRKMRTQLELCLLRDMRGNKMGFNSCITKRRKPRENVYPLLNGTLHF